MKAADTVTIRAGRGRPKKAITETLQVGVRVTEALNAAIDKAAAKTGRSKSNWIKAVIHKALYGDIQ